LDARAEDDLTDGYIARYEEGAFRIVAEGFRFTNEIRFDEREEFLYVVETTGGCISRLRVDSRGNLSGREIFGPSSLGRGRGPTASLSTRLAICGGRWSIPTSSSC
jgi:gluconolactonase